MRGSSHDSLSPPESIVLGLADSAITLRNTFEKYLEMYYEYYSSGSTNPFAYPSTLGVLQLYDSKSRQETKFPNQCNDGQPSPFAVYILLFIFLQNLKTRTKWRATVGGLSCLRTRHTLQGYRFWLVCNTKVQALQPLGTSNAMWYPIETHRL